MVFILIYFIFLIKMFYKQKIKNILLHPENESSIVKFIFLTLIFFLLEFFLFNYFYCNFDFFSSLIIISLCYYFFFRDLSKFFLLKLYFFFFSRLWWLRTEFIRLEISVFFIKLDFFFFKSFFLHNKLSILLVKFFILGVFYCYSFSLFFAFYLFFNSIYFFLVVLQPSYDGLIYGIYCDFNVIIKDSGYLKLKKYMDYVFNTKHIINKIYLDFDFFFEDEI